MTASSGQPPALPAYLASHRFGPHAGHAWFDRDTGHGIIRVVCEPGEDTQLICLTPAGVCRYKALFSPGTPHTVIIAALEAALNPPPPRAGSPPGSRAGRRRAGNEPGAPRTREGKR